MMVIQVTHKEFANATPESVWQIWSDVSTWSTWDHGIEWCKLKEKSRFELYGEAFLLPKGAPFPLSIRIIECTPNKSFTDEGVFPLGSIRFSHVVVPQKNGVEITHTLTYTAADPKSKEAFETQMLPKLKQELPQSVKTLAKIAEQKKQEAQTVSKAKQTLR